MLSALSCPSLSHQFYGSVPLVLREFSSHPYRSLEHPLANVMQGRERHRLD